MKRDFDLIRRLLLKTEENEGVTNVWEIDIRGVSEDKIHYHVYLLKDAGLVSADVETLEDGTLEATVIYRLTWEGHEFLDAVRNDLIWKKTKNIIIKKMGTAPIDIVKQVAVQLIGSALSRG